MDKVNNVRLDYALAFIKSMGRMGRNRIRLLHPPDPTSLPELGFEKSDNVLELFPELSRQRRERGNDDH